MARPVPNNDRPPARSLSISSTGLARSNRSISTSTTQQLPSHVSPTGFNFLSLPLELRLTIYELASSSRFSTNLVKDNGGRLLYRLAWPSSPLDYRNPEQQQIDTLSSINRQTRAELLPRMMRGYIVKFPAWTPEFKLQCLYWLEVVSEKFCRSIDWFWMEGLYWRFSLHLTGDGNGEERSECREMQWEDQRAQSSDVHRHAVSETFVRPGRYILRVDCAKHIRNRACASAKRFARTVEKLLLAANIQAEGADGRLGKDQVVLMLTWAALTGAEQIRECEEDVEGVEGGISVIHYDSRRSWVK